MERPIELALGVSTAANGGDFMPLEKTSFTRAN
jgi:hypothetical protein